MEEVDQVEDELNTDESQDNENENENENENVDDNSDDSNTVENKADDNTNSGDDGNQDPPWRVGLKEENLKIAKRHASANSVFDSLRKALNLISSTIRVPSKDATEEEIAKFNKAMQVPQTADGYLENLEIEDEESKARIDRFRTKAHELALPAPKVREIFDWFASESAQSAQARDDARAKELQTAENELRKQYGTPEQYDRNVAIAVKTAGHFGGEQLAQELEKTGFGNNPAFVETFAKIGHFLSEDMPHLMQSSTETASNRAALDAEYNERLSKGTLNDPDFQARWTASFSGANAA